MLRLLPPGWSHYRFRHWRRRSHGLELAMVLRSFSDGGKTLVLTVIRIFYIQLIIYGASFVLILFSFRETRGPVILAKRLKTNEKASGADECVSHQSQAGHGWPARAFIKENILRPAYLLVTEPVVFFFTLLTALSYGLVFLSTQSVTLVYQTFYGWSESSTALVQASILIGEVVGFFACLYQNRIFRLAFEKNNSNSTSKLPEVRLYLAIPASFIGLAGGLFWYGWTCYPKLHWIFPTIGLCLIGYGSMGVMTAVMMYLTDAYAKYAASASAAACFGENVFAAFLPLATNAMYAGSLGFHWASSLLGFIALALSFAPIVLIWKGEEIRRRSPFMAVAVYS